MKKIIEHVPPISERDGFIFDGWYTESERTSAWNFEAACLLDLPDKETFIETKLCAKWTGINN